AVGPQLLGVHVDAMTAAIDLRSSELHQFEKGMFKAAFANEDMQIADRLGALRRCLAEIHSSFHGDYPFVGFQLGLGANNFWASGRVMSVSNNSNSPLARSSSAICRVSDMATSEGPDAVLTRATPSFSSCETFGPQGLPTMFMGTFNAVTRSAMIFTSVKPNGKRQSAPAAMYALPRRTVSAKRVSSSPTFLR